MSLVILRPVEELGWFGRAEPVLLAIMPHLTHELDGHGDRAWR